MLQKRLKDTRLSATGATFARFVYSAPLVAVLMAGYFAATGLEVPQPDARFFAFAFTGGIAQILATICVVALFAERNFAVGITFKKTEVVLTALTGLLVLGEGVGMAGALAIGIGFFGLILLSDPPEGGKGWRRFFNKAAALGLGAGLLFSFSAIGYRGASPVVGRRRRGGARGLYLGGRHSVSIADHGGLDGPARKRRGHACACLVARWGAGRA